MSQGGPMKIDIYSHIMTKKYTELYARKNPAIKQRVEYRSIAVTDLEVRLRLMNRYPDVLQVLTVANIPLETFAEPADERPRRRPGRGRPGHYPAGTEGRPDF